MILDVGTVHEDLVADTNWLASRLSGWNGPPPGVEGVLQSENDALSVLVHRKTPMKNFIKEYLVQKVDEIFRVLCLRPAAVAQRCKTSCPRWIIVL